MTGGDVAGGSDAATVAIDRVPFFDALADELNAHPERVLVYGEADMVVDIVVRRPAGEPLRVRLTFEGLRCDGVTTVEEGTTGADFSLEGDRAAWEEMFRDIVTNGRATGLWTINSLAMLGGAIERCGTDPMGLDKFFRFNQTLQVFLDGAAQVAVPAP